MIGMVIQYQLKPEAVDAFLAACRANAAGAHAEPGNRRFDLVQSSEDPTRVVLIECYVDEAAKRAHLASPHFQAWREATKDAHAAPPSFLGGAYLFGRGLEAKRA